VIDLGLQEDRSQRPLHENGQQIPHMDDSRSREMFLLEEKALVLMIKIIDNPEEYKELCDNLQTIMEDNEMLETRVLSLFQVLINGIKLEYNQLDYAL
jgi:hypothetical protein